MYVLDTNAFYYAAGISEFSYDVEKLRALIKNNECFISSTSLFEFLIKYQSDLKTIHKGGKYLFDNNIIIAGNVINPLPENFVGDIRDISKEELDKLCLEILENKIDVESRFISLLFDMCLFSGYYFILMKDGKEPSGVSCVVMEKIYKTFAGINLNVFMDIFKEGYETGDCENYVRNCFYNLLAFELEKGLHIFFQTEIIRLQRHTLLAEKLFRNSFV